MRHSFVHTAYCNMAMYRYACVGCIDMHVGDVAWCVGSLAPGICWVVLWWVVHGVVDAAMVDGVWCSG